MSGREVMMMIGNKAYRMSELHANQTLETIEMQFKGPGIYAVRKGRVIELKNQVFKTDEEISRAVKDYERLKFKVWVKWDP